MTYFVPHESPLYVSSPVQSEYFVQLLLTFIMLYVRTKTPCSCRDIEAQKRGTTFYLVDRRFDMLPSLLSSGEHLLPLMFGVAVLLVLMCTAEDLMVFLSLIE